MWSEVVLQFIPDYEKLSSKLESIKCDLAAQEILLIERKTFLCLGRAINEHEIKAGDDSHRNEKISNILKQFRSSCQSFNCQLESMCLEAKNTRRNSHPLRIFIEDLKEVDGNEDDSFRLFIVNPDLSIGREGIKRYLEAAKQQ